MARWRVLTCALVAASGCVALAVPAAAKKPEVIREFEASGSGKLASTGINEQKLVFKLEEHGAVAVKCEAASGKGEITTTEGKATSFLDKVSFSGCFYKKKKNTIEEDAKVSPVEFEFHANGLMTIKNEVKVKLPFALCTILVSPQTVGEEALEEHKKTPDSYASVNNRLEVKTKVRTHEEGEEGGIVFEPEKAFCEETAFKEEGGKYDGNMLVTMSGKEPYIRIHEQPVE